MTILTFILCLFCAILTAPPNQGFIIPASEPYKPYESLWNATCAVESNFNPLAIGDKHLKKHSFGIVQIRESRLDDYNRKNGTNYTRNDLFNPIICKKIFMYYCRSSDLETISRSWNGGENGMNKKSTLQYWILIKSKL